MIYERHDCRMCGGDLRMMLELTPTPLANSFPDKPYMGEKIPLEVMQCLECDHVQLHHVASAEDLYIEYKYATPTAVRPHLESYAKTLRGMYPKAKTALEIGCNNGLFLDVLKEQGFEVLGMDPSASGENTIRGFFGADTAPSTKFDLILANNVFAHIDNLHGAFQGIDKCLSPDGVVVFEVQYLPDMVRAGTFDMIYHEHHDYHTLKPWERFLKRHGLVISWFEFIPAHGGSVRVFCKRPGIGLQLPNEPIDWRAFEKRIEEMKRITQLRLDGRQLKMFGAPAKATTLIHHFGIQGNIFCALDSTPQKQGRYIPGTGIQILQEKDLTREMFLASWNFADVVRKKYPDTRFIVPGEQMPLLEAA
jgi:SAM-dependent methyltransferase